MTLASAAGFSLAMTLLAASPGPGVLAVVGSSLGAGWRKTLIMIAGIVTGDLVYLLFAVFGLTYLARNMGSLFTLVRLAGGLYLVFIGIRGLLSREGEGEESNRGRTPSRAIARYMNGLLITLSNPKAILFYCGFLPTFADLSRLTPADGLLIVTLVVLILGSVMFCYARLADSLGQRMKGPGGRNLINRTGGGVMAAAGIYLILKRP